MGVSPGVLAPGVVPPRGPLFFFFFSHRDFIWDFLRVPNRPLFQGLAGKQRHGSLGHKLSYLQSLTRVFESCVPGSSKNVWYVAGRDGCGRYEIEMRAPPKAVAVICSRLPQAGVKYLLGKRLLHVDEYLFRRLSVWTFAVPTIGFGQTF
eukprot:FR744061.1.p1 GENE.FR744061.1~~FR744061.1.p1  ORF type:complete len:150 (-),score=23.03 FR744061.1:611-1060(-)